MKVPVGKKLLCRAISMVALAAIGSGSTHAQEMEALNAITTQDLLKLLVEEGVLDKEKVGALADKLKERKAREGAKLESTTVQRKDIPPAAEPGVVRVPYVPTYVKDEIRDQVRIGLKEDVTRDVLSQAKQERWGLPGVVPEWVERVKFSGDMRLRSESTFYAAGNVQGDYLDIPYVNEQGSFDANDSKVFLNTTENRHRLRGRFRLGVKAKVNNQVEVGARMVSGNASDPISTNQTLGSYGEKWENNFDLAYLRYRSTEGQIIASGGRIENPFFSSDLVWDSDLTFEGIAASWWMLRSNNIMDEFRAFDPFVTVGAFPIGEVDQSSQDKWLYAFQSGFQYDFINQSKLTTAVAYYAYDNIVGERNSEDSRENDYTAPAYMQKSNLLFNIRNPSLSSSQNDFLFAHAVDYKLANIYVEYDIAAFAPIHLIVAGDYVKNLGWDEEEVADRIGFYDGGGKTEGYQARVTLGWPQISKQHDWQISFIYRYLERDAVLDAFTDSDFHGGGTDAQGYILRFDYGLLDNVWMTARWLSANEIDGDSFPRISGSGELGMDTLQLDLNAKF